MVTRLKVSYNNLEVDNELDRKILEFFNTLDFICIHREYDHMTLKRWLIFEKQSKEIEDGSKRNKKAQLTT